MDYRIKETIRANGEVTFDVEQYAKFQWTRLCRVDSLLAAERHVELCRGWEVTDIKYHTVKP